MAVKKSEHKEDSIEGMLTEAFETGITSTIRLIKLPIKFYVRSVNACIRLVEDALDETFPDKPPK